jgi:hypothetical protein
VNKFKEKWNALYDKRIKLGSEENWNWLKNKLDGQLKELLKRKEENDGSMLETVKDALREAKESMQARQNRQKTTSKPGSAVIVDDVILFAKTLWQLLFYFTCVLSVLQHHRVTVKLLKTRFLPKRPEFVGVDIMKEGNSPAKSKYDAIDSLERPELFTDLRMLIGMIGFYRHWVPLYEERIGPYRDIMKQAPNPGTSSNEEEATLLRTLWTQNDQLLFETLKGEITTGPVLKRPDPNRRFYLKTDWSAHAQGAVLLQAGCTDEEEAAVQREIHGEKCEYDKTVSGLRLRPIAFISQRRQEPSSRHSFVGEASEEDGQC